MNPKVFLSYSHDSEDHKTRVLDLALTMRGDHGIDVELDQFHTEEIVDWPRWCNEMISRDHSDFVVCICTLEYCNRIEGKVPPERGKGVYWEGSLLDDDVYNAKGNRRILPLLLGTEQESSIPRFLRGWTYCKVDTFTLQDSGYQHLIRILTGQAQVEKNPLGPIPVLTPRTQSCTHTPPSNLPLSMCKTLVGRDFAPIDAILARSDWCAVSGMGGLGKSELVLQYAKQSLSSSPPTFADGIVWIRGLAGDLASQIVTFARQQCLDQAIPDGLDLEAQLRFCYRHWRGTQKVLLIFDDVQDFSALRDILPTEPRFRILLTTRLDPQSPYQSIHLPFLSPEASLELLTTYVGQDRIKKEPITSAKLCMRLGHLPLALELVGRYLGKRQDISVPTIVQELQDLGLQHPGLLAKAAADTTAQQGVQAAFQLSWKRLKKDARRLACRLTLCAPVEILWDLVAQSWGQELADIRDEQLLEWHLLQRVGENRYLLHPLLRDFFSKHWSKPEYRFQDQQSLAKVLVQQAKKIPYRATVKDVETLRPYAKHLEYLLEYGLKSIDTTDLIWAFEGVDFRTFSSSLFAEIVGFSDNLDFYPLQIRLVKTEKMVTYTIF